MFFENNLAFFEDFYHQKGSKNWDLKKRKNLIKNYEIQTEIFLIKD